MLVDNDADTNESVVVKENNLFCHEELGPPSLNPNTFDVDAPSLHYGLYMKMKPHMIHNMNACLDHSMSHRENLW
jgi:hypothetical protein